MAMLVGCPAVLKHSLKHSLSTKDNKVLQAFRFLSRCGAPQQRKTCRTSERPWVMNLPIRRGNTACRTCQLVIGDDVNIECLMGH